MGFTNYGAQALAWSLGSDISNNFIQSIGIGSGSGATGVTNVTLQAEHTRTVQTGSPDFTTARKASFQGDFNSVVMSGLILTEFGLFASGAVNTGSTWQREAFGSVVFDGTNELQISTTLEVLPG